MGELLFCSHTHPPLPEEGAVATDRVIGVSHPIEVPQGQVLVAFALLVEPEINTQNMK